MHLKTRNVNTAFRTLVELFHTGEYSTSYWTYQPTITRRSSRVGEVMVIEEPVIITYEKPRERVLFNAARDANPFFHLMESLWMLAGRNDIAPLTYYSGNYAAQVQDGDSPTANGAYGYRWRRAKADDGEWSGSVVEKVDQLKLIIAHLKANPDSRRAVLSMWSVEDDLLKIGEGNCTCRPEHNHGKHYPGCQVNRASKDVCCNLNVMFSLRSCRSCAGGVVPTDRDDNECKLCHGRGKYLDMTVTNRSNDMIWGMLGANAVHFSFLQEYMAAHLGVEVGVYNQMTNNLHCYVERWHPEKWLEDDTYEKVCSGSGPIGAENNGPSLVSDPVVFEEELPCFVERFAGKVSPEDLAWGWQEPFFERVAQPMLIAFAYHKEKDYYSALSCVDGIEADDWRIVARNWVERRMNRVKH
jgi:thymidylate synthase